ncbi:CHAT domain-containing protein [Microseira sp. BLCC-F43]|jgi:CHAT domain-containing protein/tetratricopeptide (TPR) repeat protein|uniref:CHAT domain-containing tetratricopeptide repeat protein n=1 Tax=Microseira sp. BLCC-F43 TaxID=3153602 RepID=UPI0035B94FBE
MQLPPTGLIALITIFATLKISDCQSIQNPQFKLQNFSVLVQAQDTRKAEADRLFQQGIEHLNSGQAEAALQSLQQALNIYREIKDRQGEGKTLRNLGTAYLLLGNSNKAIESYQQSLAIAQSIRNRKLEWEALYFLGKAYFVLGDYAKAIESYQQVWTIARELKDQALELQIMMELGFTYNFLGNTAKAIDVYQQNLIIARQLKNHQAEGYTLLNLGMIYKQLEDHTKAIEYFEQSLAIARSINNRLLEGQALGNLGDAYLVIGQPAKAIEFYQQSLSIARELKNTEFKEMALKLEEIALGAVRIAYNLLGDFAKLSESLQQELRLAQELKDPQREGTALRELGTIYQGIDDYTKAIEYFEKSLAIAQQFNDIVLKVQALESLADTYLTLGDFDKALDYSQQSLATVQAFNNSQRQEQNISSQQKQKINYLRRKELQALGRLGATYLFGIGDYSKALDYFQQGLVLARKFNLPSEEANALSNLGIANSVQGDYSQAIPYYEQSLALVRQDKRPQFESINRQIEGIELRFLARAYAVKGEQDKAIDYAQQSVAIAQKSESLFDRATAKEELGYVLFLAGNLPEAEKALRETIAGYESIRAGLGEQYTYKVSIFDIQSEAYRLLEQVLIAQNKTDAALEIAERGRGRALVELLTKRLSPQPDAQSSINPPTIEQIKRIAKEENATLVEYSITYDPTQFILPGKFKAVNQNPKSELYIWVIKPTGEVAFRRSNLKPLWQQQNTSLEALVFSSRESIGVRSLPLLGWRPRPEARQSPASLTERLQQLHKFLIEPIADLLPNDPNARVIFIPQGELFLVPFPALQDRPGKYLIEKHTILTAPAIEVLQLTQQQREKVRQAALKDALVVGNPTMPKFGQPPQPLDPLPNAEKEALAIAPLLSTKPLLGKDATKADIVQKMPSARIIHLATHGLLDDIRGLGSAIALAPSSNDNGLLTAEEILDLKLAAELVVLSACDTGRGRITGDGVIGLSRSLISAGVPSVIVSLWSVPDAPTAALMTEFYQNLQKHPNKAQALRQAMLTSKQQHPNPKDWAAFTLIGEAE